MKIASTLQYNGSAFAGFQKQKNERTVQEELEKVIYKIFRLHTTIYAAGRTDSGVHAYGQVVHFSLPDDCLHPNKTLAEYIYGFNALLPNDISIIHAEVVPKNFHARFSCQSREYLYQILNSDYRMAFYQQSYLWVRDRLNTDKMQEAGRLLLGEHDFAAFTKKVYSNMNENTIRLLQEVHIINTHPFIFIHFKGSGFLHNMIRIITGLLLNVGKEKIEPQEVQRILESRNRIHCGATMPPHALFFLRANYENYRTPDNLVHIPARILVAK